jgi:hypothetical protein
MAVRGTSPIDTFGDYGPDMRDGNWHYVAATITTSQISLYVDGTNIWNATGTWIATTNDLVVTIEENVLPGGFGSGVLEHLEDAFGGRPEERARVLRLGLPDRYVTHGKPALLREEAGLTGPARGLHRKTHQVIERVTSGIETSFHFNTAIAALHELVGEIASFKVDSDPTALGVYREALEALVKMLGPMAPHIAEELWEQLGNTASVFRSSWPVFQKESTAVDEVELAIQVNGKIRGKITVPAGTGNKEMETLALADEKVQSFLEGMTVRKVIVIPGRLVNIVVG